MFGGFCCFVFPKRLGSWRNRGLLPYCADSGFTSSYCALAWYSLACMKLGSPSYGSCSCIVLAGYVRWGHVREKCPIPKQLRHRPCALASFLIASYCALLIVTASRRLRRSSITGSRFPGGAPPIFLFGCIGPNTRGCTGICAMYPIGLGLFQPGRGAPPIGGRGFWFCHGVLPW